MATSTENAANTKDKFDDYLTRRIAQTIRQVTLVELLSFFLTLAVGLLAVLFVLCLVDAWIIELSVTMRWIALGLLLLGSLGLAFYRAFPFLIHRINPLYAARKLEEGRPELKNSVINYLTTRFSNDKKIDRSIRKRLSETAASEVSHIPLDVAVDRSPMIMAGYALTGMVTLFALYKIFSPKDPFQTIGRVVLPSAVWMAPARVSISDVLPGDAKKYFGDDVEITARIRGLRNGETANLLVTTDSGTQKDQLVPMGRDETGDIFRVSIGGASDAATVETLHAGLQESFSYRIQAGDATSSQFRIEVRTSPTVFVEQIQYRPPSYTGIENRIETLPDRISGVEGAVAHITARTNLPVETAYLKLFRLTKNPEDKNSIEKGEKDGDESPETDSGKSQGIELEGQAATKSVKCDVEGDYQISCQFPLELNSKRTRARFTHFQLVFTATDGSKSEGLTLAPIEVIPDLNPEIEVLAPTEKVTEIPQNQTVKIEISAVDPDYGLTSIMLVAENRGTRLFEKLVFKSPEKSGLKGIQVGHFLFRPTKFGLKPGDEVVWFARAEDNRALGLEQLLVPNRVRTDNRKIVIVPALENSSTENSPPQQENSDKESGQENQPKSESQEEQSKTGQGENQESPSDPQQTENQGKQDSNQGESQGEQKTTAENQPPEKQSPAESSGKGKGAQEDQGDSQNDKSNSGQQDRQEGNQNQKGSGRPEGSNGSENSGQQKQGNSGSRNPAPENSQNQSTNSPQGSGKQQSGGQENGVRQGEAPQNGEPRESGEAVEPSDSRDSQGEQTERRKPQNSREAFERLKKYFDEKNRTNKDSDPSTNHSDSEPGQTTAQPGNKPDSSDQSKKDPSKLNEPGGNDSIQNKSNQGNGEKSKSSQEDTKRPRDNRSKSGDDSKATDQKSKGSPEGTKKQRQSDPDKNSGSNRDPDRSDPKKEDASGNPGKQERNGQRKPEKVGNQQPEQRKTSDDKSGDQSQADAQDVKKGKFDNDSKAKASDTKESGDDSSAGKANRSQQSRNDSGGRTGDVERPDAEGGQDSISKNKSRGNAVGEEAKAQQANLEYTKKATEMVLEKLADQEREVDPELLKNLNWTEEELREFNRRWQAIRDKAKTGRAEDRQRFEEALRSLGLKDPANDLSNANLQNDQKAGYQQKSGTRRVPSDFARKFRAIQKSQQKLDRNK